MPIAELAIDLAGQSGPAGMLTPEFGEEEWDMVIEGIYHEFWDRWHWSPQWGTPRMCRWKDGCVREVLSDRDQLRTICYTNGMTEVLLRKDA
jgi:hypothetical protein